MGQQRQSVEKLFGEALNMAPEARRAFLDAACRDEPELKHLVEQLLMEDERAGSFLKEPLFDLSTNTGFQTDAIPLTPDSALTRSWRWSVLVEWERCIARGTRASGGTSPSKFSPLIFRSILI